MSRKKVTLLLVCVMMVVGSIYGIHKTREVVAAMPEIISKELSKSMETDIAIGSITMDSWHTIAVQKISIYDKKGQLLFDCDKAIVHINPLDIVFGKPPIETISEIEVNQFQFHLTERETGIWNFSDLVKAATPGAPRFQGTVKLASGIAVLNLQKGQWEIQGIEGSIDLATINHTKVTLTGSYQGAKVSAKGYVGKEQTFSLEVKAADLDAADFKTFIPENNQVVLETGKAKNVVVNIKNDTNGLIFGGQGTVYDVEAVAAGYKVSKAKAELTFTNKNIYLYQAEGDIAGQEVHVSGKIALYNQPIFSLTIKSPAIDPSLFVSGLPFQGIMAVNARVYGSLDDIRAEGKVTAKNGMFKNYSVQDTAANFSYKDQIVSIAKITTSVFDGSLTGSGLIHLQDQAYYFEAVGKQMNSEAVALIDGLQGRANIEVAISGQGNAMPAVIGKAELTSGEYKGIAFHSIKCSFAQTGEDTSIEYLNVLFPEGYATFSGHVRSGQLQGSLQGHALPLALLGKQFNVSATGTFELSGTLEGSTDQPVFIAAVLADTGQIYGQPFTRLEGALTIKPNRVTIQNMMVINNKGEHRIRGDIGLTEGKIINLAVSTRQVRAENLIQAALPGEQLTGNLDNELIIKGSLANIEAEGHFVLTDGSVRGHLLHKAEGYYKYLQGMTTLSGIQVDMVAGKGSLSGTVGNQGELNLMVAADHIDLARLRLEYPYPVTGKADFNGSITGTTQNPVIIGDVSAKAITINQEQMQDIVAGITVTGSQVGIGYSQFFLDGGLYKYSGWTDWKSHFMQGDISIEKGEVGNFFTLFNQPSYITGRLDGTVNLGGTWENPDILMNGHFKEGKIKHYPLTSIDVDVALSNHVLKINQFTAKQNKGILAAQGTADLHGSVDVEIGARDLDAGILADLFDAQVQTDGKLNISAQISGLATEPRTAVSMEIKEGAVAGGTFDNLYGLFILEHGSININQLYVAKGEYKTSAYGVIPLKALNTKGIKEATIADQMDITFNLDHADLSILPHLSKQVSWAYGPTKGQVHIGGTLMQPKLSGQLQINDGVVKITSLAYPIQKVGVDIQLEGDKIMLNTLEGKMGLGSFHLSGAADLVGLAFSNYNMSLVLDRLGIQHEYFKGPLSGNLMLAEVAGKPKLSGKVLFEEDTINIPVLPTLVKDKAGLEVLLDVDVNTGKKVRFYNSYFYDFGVSGSAHLGGSTLRPLATGKFEVTRGTVSYLRTPFKILSGSAEFTQFRSFEPTIKLIAETKLEQTVVNLNISGPASTMEMKLTSEPAMSQQEIISLLTLRSRYFDKSKTANAGLGRDELVSLLDAGLQMRFMAEVESTLREALGLDELKVIRGTVTMSDSSNKSQQSDEIYQAELSKYVTDKLMLTYTMGLDRSTHSWGFQYDLTHRLSLAGAVDEQNRRKIGLEMRFHF